MTDTNERGMYREHGTVPSLAATHGACATHIDAALQQTAGAVAAGEALPYDADTVADILSRRLPTVGFGDKAEHAAAQQDTAGNTVRYIVQLPDVSESSIVLACWQAAVEAKSDGAANMLHGILEAERLAAVAGRPFAISPEAASPLTRPGGFLRQVISQCEEVAVPADVWISDYAPDAIQAWTMTLAYYTRMHARQDADAAYYANRINSLVADLLETPDTLTRCLAGIATELLLAVPDPTLRRRLVRPCIDVIRMNPNRLEGLADLISVATQAARDVESPRRSGLVACRKAIVAQIHMAHDAGYGPRDILKIEFGWQVTQRWLSGSTPGEMVALGDQLVQKIIAETPEAMPEEEQAYERHQLAIQRDILYADWAVYAVHQGNTTDATVFLEAIRDSGIRDDARTTCIEAETRPSNVMQLAPPDGSTPENDELRLRTELAYARLTGTLDAQQDVALVLADSLATHDSAARTSYIAAVYYASHALDASAAAGLARDLLARFRAARQPVTDYTYLSGPVIAGGDAAEADRLYRDILDAPMHPSQKVELLEWLRLQVAAALEPATA